MMRRGTYDRSHLKGATHTLCRQCGERFAYKIYGQGRNRHYNRYQIFCDKKCADDFQCKGWGTDKSGYQIQYRSNGQGRRIYVQQHRQVMEERLGRKLATHETVHHKDGNRANNRIENLELWSSRHGRGQRVADKIEFARSFLAEYGVDAPLCSVTDAVRGIAGCI